MPIIYPTVPSLDELADLLAWPVTEGPINRIQVERSATGGGAGYSNAGSVTLAAATLNYTFYDITGTGASWYRWYYSNAANTFPAVGQREYSAEVQASDPGSGLICSLGDARQRIESNSGSLSDNEQEQVIAYIRQVTSYIHGRTGRLFTRTPANGTTTYLLDVLRAGRTLWVPKGIAAATTLEVASSSQPETAGTYATVAAAEWFLRPTLVDRDAGWPATQVAISNVSGSYFAAGYNTVRLTGALGWDTVPADIAAVALTLVVAAFRERASSGGDSVTIGLDGERRYERSLSYQDRLTLDRYSIVP